MSIKDIFLNKMEKFILDEELIPEGSGVCCALSGGADSVALLIGILLLKEKLSIEEVSAVHINHCLRGEESDGDEQFCRDLCDRLGVVIHVHRCDVNAYREKNGSSVETAARQCRYSAFEKERGLIATAHTASDNLETVLQRIARGTGLHGLCGIPVKRERFIRPILFASRSEIEAFLNEQGECFVTDSTNNSDDYTRNRIRHNIVPLLQELNPAVEKRVFEMCSSLRADDKFFDEECNEAYIRHFKEPMCLTDILDLPAAVRVRCEAKLLEKCGISYNSRMIRDIERIVKSGGKCHLAGDFDCFVSKNELVIRKKVKTSDLNKEIPFRIGKQSLFFGIFFASKLITDESEINVCIINKKLANHLLDYDKIKGCVTLRSRRPGDRIQLAGRDFTVSIKKRIQEVVPLRKRQTLHFLEDEEGVVYAEDIGIAERVKPVVGVTKKLLFLSTEYEDGKSLE